MNDNNNNGEEEHVEAEPQRTITVIPENISLEDLTKRITVKLANEGIWSKFETSQLEMICNKYGRNVYPKLSFDVTGLERDNCYLFSLAFRLADDTFTYKYIKEKWVPFPFFEKDDELAELPHGKNNEFPCGFEWMYKPITFEKIKLTNSAVIAKEHFATHAYVKTFRKYRPKLFIYRFNPDTTTFNRFFEKDFPAADFIAVTAYHNSKVSDIKIQHNQYARAFRIENIFVSGTVEGKENSFVASTGKEVSQSPAFQRSTPLPSSSSSQLVFRRPLLPIFRQPLLPYRHHHAYHRPYYIPRPFQQRQPPPNIRYLRSLPQPAPIRTIVCPVVPGYNSMLPQPVLWIPQPPQPSFIYNGSRVIRASPLPTSTTRKSHAESDTVIDADAYFVLDD